MVGTEMACLAFVARLALAEGRLGGAAVLAANQDAAHRDGSASAAPSALGADTSIASTSSG